MDGKSKLLVLGIVVLLVTCVFFVWAIVDFRRLGVDGVRCVSNPVVFAESRLGVGHVCECRDVVVGGWNITIN